MLTNVFDSKGVLIVNGQTFSSRTGKTSGLPKDWIKKHCFNMLNSIETRFFCQGENKSKLKKPG